MTSILCSRFDKISKIMSLLSLASKICFSLGFGFSTLQNPKQDICLLHVSSCLLWLHLFSFTMMVSYALFSKSRGTSKTLKPYRRGNTYQPSCISYRYICTKLFLLIPQLIPLVSMVAGFSSMLTCPVHNSSIATASLTA